MAIKIDTDGNVTNMGFYPDMKTLNEAVEGYIEMVSLPTVFKIGEKSYQYMYVNEEGMMKNLPLNTMATSIAGQTIIGNVVLMDDDDRRKDME